MGAGRPRAARGGVPAVAFRFPKNSVNHVPIRQSHFLWLLAAVPALVALAGFRCGSDGRRMARFAAPALLGDLAPETAPGRLAAQIPALRRCRGAAGTRRRASAGRLETPRAESRRRGADAGGRCLELDAGRGFRTQAVWSVRSMPSTASFEGLGQERIGLVVFAANPACSCP